MEKNTPCCRAFYLYVPGGSINSHYFHNQIVGVYIPIIRIPFKGGMTIPKKARLLTMVHIGMFLEYNHSAFFWWFQVMLIIMAGPATPPNLPRPGK